MSRIVRAAVALMIAVVCATAPLALDRCAAACEALQSAAASTPSCHQSSKDTIPRIGHRSAVCSHDANGTVSTTASKKTSLSDAHLLAVAPGLPEVGTPIAELFTQPASSPPITSRFAEPARPLRV